MTLIKDIIQTNKDIIIKSFKLAIKNWKIFLVGIAYSVIWLGMNIIASYAGILGGIIAAIFQSAIISNYLVLIENIINYEKFTLEDFKSGFLKYLWKIYSVFVIFYLVRFGMSLFIDPILSYTGVFGISIWLMIRIVAFIMLNALPEVIYQKHYERLDIISYTFEFIKENWIEWFIPNGFIIAAAYVVRNITDEFILFTGFSGNFFISLAIIVIVYQLMLSYAMIYRGQLFDILSTSTRRKRMFMRNMYK